MELATLPPQTLNPVRLKHLCALLSDDILDLLKISAPTLRDLGHLELLCSYMGAVEKAVLKELNEKSSQAAKKQSRPFQALLSLHSYMDPCNLREVISKLLLLPQERLISFGSEGAQAQPSIYGHAALQILTEFKSNASQDHNTFLTKAHLQGLSILLMSCSSPALEALLLQTLSSEPGCAKLIHPAVLLHCLQRPLPDTQAITSLLLQNSSSHRLCFELWCLEPENMEKLSDQTETFIPLIKTYLQVASREDPARPQDGLYYIIISSILSKHTQPQKNFTFSSHCYLLLLNLDVLICCLFIVQKEVLKAFKQRLLAKLSQCVLGNLTEDSGVQLVETLASLIKLSANVSDIRDLNNSLPSVLQKVDSFER